MVTVQQLKSWLRPFRNTPLHPQWLISRSFKQISSLLRNQVQGRLLDIGCGNGQVKKSLRESVTYIGLDYPATMALGYEGKPDILADASKLPVADRSIDTVIKFDVLEHFADPELAISETSRVLTPGGQVLLRFHFFIPCMTNRMIISV